jgi:hypothetical protein
VRVEPLQTVKQHYRVERSQIAFMKFIFEAYDGIALIETLDPDAGLIVLHIAPGCEPEVAVVLQDLEKDILMERVQISA